MPSMTWLQCLLPFYYLILPADQCSPKEKGIYIILWCDFFYSYCCFITQIYMHEKHWILPPPYVNFFRDFSGSWNERKAVDVWSFCSYFCFPVPCDRQNTSQCGECLPLPTNHWPKGPKCSQFSAMVLFQSMLAFIIPLDTLEADKDVSLVISECRKTCHKRNVGYGKLNGKTCMCSCVYGRGPNCDGNSSLWFIW